VEKRMKMEATDEYELAVLADTFETYATNAQFCKQNGKVYDMPTKTGTYPMIRPEYTIMNKAQAHILKHAGKFGLNPGDRDKIGAKAMKEPEKKKEGFNLKMEVA